MKFIDLTNKKFGKLTVLKYYSKNKFGVSLWVVKCDCGSEELIVRGYLLGKTIFSCGICSQKNNTEKTPTRSYFIKNTNSSALNQLIYSYRKNAKRRGLDFLLSNEEFIKLTSSNCYYCGKEPSMIQRGHNNKSLDYIYNGIDRVNSSISYIYINCVPACKQCNFAKSSYSKDEFTFWIDKVYNHLHGE